jgi:hypothetical protein
MLDRIFRNIPSPSHSELHLYSLIYLLPLATDYFITILGSHPFGTATLLHGGAISLETTVTVGSQINVPIELWQLSGVTLAPTI